MKQFLLKIFISVAALIACECTSAQVKEPVDTFFLLKKKGLLKKLGKSIYREAPAENPVKAVDPFLQYKGMIIRTIQVAPTGFNKIVHDTLGVRKTFASTLADKFHKNTLQPTIRKNLFFKEGDRVLPLLIADNERYLRDLTFIKDALIVLQPAEGYPNMVDVLIVTRDVFSIGGSFNVSSTSKGRIVLREDNVSGTGNRIEGTAFYDKDRDPKYGVGASVIQRNISHSFINWSAGFNTFNPAFNSGRRDETSIYTSFDKPLTSRYTQWTGAASVAYNVSNNGYLPDSVYISDFKYKVFSSDLWAGYNIGARNRKDRDMGKRLRHFVALRTFYNDFSHVPDKFSNVYNYSYADINGLLASYSLYRQNFFKTNFIYGFGRNEDVPEGVNASVVGGYTNKEGVKRAYYGLEFDATHYSLKGCYTAYNMRLGGFTSKKDYRDVNLVLQIDKFTKLYTLGSKWLNRNFFTVNFTRQFNTSLGGPLFLESTYGLPYFRYSTDIADTRATVKFETVFYNLNRVLGFRFAPFLFTDASFLKPVNKPIEKTNGYTAIGGGIRTRNENLTFGTIELRGYYFPRVNDGMKNWKVEVSTKVRFRFNSSFIRRPDFISPN
jgi:hypothetical protein